MKLRRRLFFVAVLATPALLGLLAVGVFLFAQQGGAAPFRLPVQRSAPTTSASLVERGQYLARIGNCVGCHTVEGGVALAGGRAFRTDYGTVYSSNLTADPQHGIGDWSSEEFRHAMRHGVSRNGVLSPVFPYASFQHLSDDDLDALLAFLRSAPAASAPRQPNAFSFPANLPGAMTAWRLLYFRPAARLAPTGDAAQRGAYLVEGLGHCGTCHASRGAFASRADGGGLWGARSGGWFAPGLHAAALQRYAEGDIARYLMGDAVNGAGGYGLMADVIARNLQYLSKDDALAIEAYLRTLPAPPPKPARAARLQASQRSLRLGRQVYERHCADCHGAEGEGTAAYPALRGSSAITVEDPINLIKLVLLGAVAPTTPGQPAPYSMPPFAHSLTAAEVADVVNFLRQQANPEALPVDVDLVHAIGGFDQP